MLFFLVRCSSGEIWYSGRCIKASGVSAVWKKNLMAEVNALIATPFRNSWRDRRIRIERSERRVLAEELLNRLKTVFACRCHGPWKLQPRRHAIVASDHLTPHLFKMQTPPEMPHFLSYYSYQAPSLFLES